MVVYLISFSEVTITDLNHSIATQLYILHISVYKNINLYINMYIYDMYTYVYDIHVINMYGHN